MPLRWLVYTLLLLAPIRCASHVPDAPGELGLQFTGMWQGAPQINVTFQQKNYAFMVRMTGYVPPEAEHIVIRNAGSEMVKWDIQWLDIMQTSPQRKYSAIWPLTVEGYYAIQNRTLQDRGTEDVFNPKDSLSSGIRLQLHAEVHSQDEKVLAAETLFVHITCDACGV